MRFEEFSGFTFFWVNNAADTNQRILILGDGLCVARKMYLVLQGNCKRQLCVG